MKYNERITYNGFTGTKKQWAKRLGISYASLFQRIRVWGISDRTFTARLFKVGEHLNDAPDELQAVAREAEVKQARIHRVAIAKARGDYYRAISLHYNNKHFAAPASWYTC